MLKLTGRDWMEIYYALESKQKTTAAGYDEQSVSWRAHLQAIMDKIGPDGVAALAEGVAPHQGSAEPEQMGQPAMYVCDSCKLEWTYEELAEAKGMQERLDIGGEVPAGECPECGALCYSPKLDLSGIHPKIA